MRHALVFPGQGAQRADMLDVVPENDTFLRLVDAAEALSGLPLARIASGGDDAARADTRAAQPLLYLADWAWGIALLESGVEPFALAGHSLGEFAALALGGVFSPEAGLELVVERSALMATAAAEAEGGMAAVIGLDSGTISSAIAGVDGVWLANDNSPSQVVISGTHDALSEAGDRLRDAGARRVIALDVAGPFHSPLMQPAADAFAELLDTAELRDATIPVLQNTCPEPATDAATIRTRLSTQIVRPVRWTETMGALRADGPVVLVEAGPGSVLKGLARSMDDVAAISADESGIEAVMEAIES